MGKNGEEWNMINLMNPSLKFLKLKISYAPIYLGKLVAAQQNALLPRHQCPAQILSLAPLNDPQRPSLCTHSKAQSTFYMYKYIYNI